MALILDRIDGTDGFLIEGPVIYSRFGSSVDGAGDINGDGFDDLIVGDPFARYYTGEAYVIFGGSDLPARVDAGSLDGESGFRTPGNEDSYLLGDSVAGTCDVNGDAIDDLIVHSFAYDNYGYHSYVLFGTTSGFGQQIDLSALDGADGFRLDGPNASAQGAGDINGDGINYLVLGNNVVFGSSTGFPDRLDLTTLARRVSASWAPTWMPFPARGMSTATASTTSSSRTLITVRILRAQLSWFLAQDRDFQPSLDLTALDGTDGFRLDNIGACDGATGSSVAGVGEINGDGVDDLIVDAARLGAAYIVFGSADPSAPNIDLSDLNGTNGFRIEGLNPDSQTGVQVAGAGDVNDDGIDDLVVADFYTGSSYVLLGFADGFAASIDASALDGADGFRLDGASEAVAGAGDVNHDGIDDLIVGGAGGYVVYGSTALGGPNDAPTAADDTLSVDAGSDVDLAADNGAGADHDPDFDSLTVTAIDGAPISVGGSITLDNGLRVTLASPTDVRFDAAGLAFGATLSNSFVYEIADGRGGTDSSTVLVDYRQDTISLADLDGSDGFRIEGARYLGYSVDAAGDVNGDGIDDLVVGASDYFGDLAETYIVFGAAKTFSPSLDLAELTGADGLRLRSSSSNGAGASVAGIGDINGDGLADVAAASPGIYFYNATAGTYVVFGSDAIRADPTIELDTLDGTTGFQVVGNESAFSVRVAGAGDVNGDSFDDLVVGSQNYGGTYAGATFVVFGSRAGFPSDLDMTALDGMEGFRVDGDYAGDQSGAAVAGGGDVNGDGLDDFVIGAPYADSGGRTDFGALYVVFGARDGFSADFSLGSLDGSSGFRLNGGATGDRTGASVAMAGDLNGDGIDDLIFGAPSADPGGRANAGASYVVFGSRDGFAANLDLASLDGGNGFRIDGARAGDLAGTVAGAGDFNGDRIDDLIIGAQGADDFNGESYILFGASEPRPAILDLADIDGLNGIRLGGSAGGASVSGVGDVNADGFDDVMVGAGYAGEAYVVFGFGSTVGSGTTSAAIAAGTDDAEQMGARIGVASKDLDIGACLVDLRFTGLEISEGATVTGAHIEFQARLSGGGPADLAIAIAVEDSTDAAHFGSGTDDIAGRDYLDETTAWSPETWTKGETYQTADLAAMLAALVGTDGIDADDAFAFRLSGTGEPTAWSFDGQGEAPRLFIEYQGPAVSSAAVEGSTVELPVDAEDQAEGFEPAGPPAWSDLVLA